MALEGILLVLALIMTFKACSPEHTHRSRFGKNVLTTRLPFAR
jgi:hypothetical protein